MRKTLSAMIAAGALAMTAAPAAYAASTAPATPQVQTRTLYVLADEQGLTGPDGKHHDSFVPSSFVVKAGEPVKLIVINYDDMMHTFTDPALGLNVMVRAGTHQSGSEAVTPSTTTATFTPMKTGQFRWNCNIPCDKGDGHGWAMTNGKDGRDRDGYMAGYVVVM